MKPVLHVTSGILHDVEATQRAIVGVILRARRTRAISAKRAHAAFYDFLELDYDDLGHQCGYLLANRDVFGVDFTVHIRGRVINRMPGESVIFRNAVRVYVTMFRSENGCLPGEPFPQYEPGSLADHLQRRGFK